MVRRLRLCGQWVGGPSSLSSGRGSVWGLERLAETEREQREEAAIRHVVAEGADAPELDELLRVRRAKLEAWRAEGVDPFGRAYARTHGAAEVVAQFATLEGARVSLAGRVRAVRGHGKLTFADLQDGTGKIQLVASEDTLGQAAYEDFRRLDLGDIIGVEGTVFRTRRGEISVQVVGFTLLAKSLRPLPEKWHGLKDVELRYRQRYLDLIVNPSVREVFITRSRILQAVRSFFVEKGFLEVETPMLHPIAGGAAARPFMTYHNALDMPLYLRIAPELYLKRLLVGGMEKVFEIGKVFRNEGISTRHNPEFTLLEAYQAYADYQDMMRLTEELYAYVAQTVLGTTRITFQGRELDLTPPWPRISMLEAIREHTGLDFAGVTDAEAARRLAARAGVKVEPTASAGEILNEVFEERVQPHLVQPVFITDHPVEVSPLARRRPDNPALTERFEPFINGWEVGNGFSELNDPIDQRERFLAQLVKRERGDEEAHMLDEDFLRALEYGMPPAGGLGVGLDRMVMLLTDSPSIRDVLLFPHMRPETSS